MSTSLKNNAYNNPEIVIGLVGAVGTDLVSVSDHIQTCLKSYSYNTIPVRVSSDIICAIEEVTESTDEYERINNMMDAGTNARFKHGNDIIALLASQIIMDKRGNLNFDKRMAYIINSLKHPEEVFALREIYGPGFYLIGVYSDENKRLSILRLKYGMKEKAKILVRKDEDEKKESGQRTRDTFHLADYFIDYSNVIDSDLSVYYHFFDIIFGNPYKTPTFDEFAMFMAFSAGLRSADLSRQIGAVITKNDEILATGANDCPKYGGGLYWPIKDGSKVIDVSNGRDYMRGYDSNAKELNRLINEISSEFERHEYNFEKTKDILANSKIKDITEYGRVVHAEMEALLCCSRNNVSTREATLYTTTFPCHNCAKHIIAAGIERVVYIEPYPKSKAPDFHYDALSLGLKKEKNKVAFQPFVGVGPRRFYEYFSVVYGTGYRKKRKESDGNVVMWKRDKALLAVKMLPSTYLDRENEAAQRCDSALGGEYGKRG